VPGLFRCPEKEDNALSQSTPAVRTVTAKKRPIKRGAKNPAGDKLLKHTLAGLKKDKAEDVVSINLHGKSEMADHMVICSGRSTRQVTALAEKTADRIKQEMGIICKLEGKDQGDWVLIDAGDIIVHIFRPEVREFYQLEKLWMDPGQAPAKG